MRRSLKTQSYYFTAAGCMIMKFSNQIWVGRNQQLLHVTMVT